MLESQIECGMLVHHVQYDGVRCGTLMAKRRIDSKDKTYLCLDRQWDVVVIECDENVFLDEAAAHMAYAAKLQKQAADISARAHDAMMSAAKVSTTKKENAT